jgi:hypothetical protein
MKLRKVLIMTGDNRWQPIGSRLNSPALGRRGALFLRISAGDFRSFGMQNPPRMAAGGFSSEAIHFE